MERIRPLEFTELYRRYSGDIFRFALYLCGDRAQAEDIVSETFVRIWTAPSPLRQGTVKAYLLAIARNLYLQGLRKKLRHVPLEESLPDGAPSQHASAQTRDELESVLRGLRELPEPDRAALLMRALEEMPYEEIAAALGISPVAAKVKVHRARVKLARFRAI